MTSSPLRNLSRVDVYVSIVLSSNIEETWSQARDFGHAPYWAQAGQGEFTVKRLVRAYPNNEASLAFCAMFTAAQTPILPMVIYE